MNGLQWHIYQTIQNNNEIRLEKRTSLFIHDYTAQTIELNLHQICAHRLKPCI